MKPSRFAVLFAMPFAALALLAGFGAAAAKAAEPPTEPILRIETGGQHTAMINRIGVDAAGRWLVTASDDKTARLWDLKTGRLDKVLRPPIGPGDEGKLYATAIRPDGATVAVAGWTQFNNGQSSSATDGHTLYLFDRASGRLLKRLTGLPNVINDLAFSPDGAWLAAGLGGKNGLRVWRVAPGGEAREAFSDLDYGDMIYGLDFSPDGRRLAATSYDGDLRLYRRGDDHAGHAWNRIARRGAPGGKQPVAVRFAPDGARLAVGYDNSTAVNVLDGETLAFLFAPDTAGVDNGQLSSVAWLGRAEAPTLAAGGTYQKSGSCPIRLWPDGGRGMAREIAAASSTIMDLRHLGGAARVGGTAGGLAFGASGPVWGVLGADGVLQRRVDSPLADLRDTQKRFHLSADGRTVRFGYVWGGSAPARFDLGRLALTRETANTPAADLSSPSLTAPGLTVSDWKNTTAPKLNGQALVLQQYERSRSLAVAPDGRGFVLGANWTLRRFNASGREVWQQPVPGTAWGVNLSADGRWVVAAYGDGTIRWHRWSDGTEILAFFPHADQKRWVAWTPSGYYAASPGGEELIGWHVNRGQDAAADFYPASRFRDRFYRPDVVQKILDTQDEASALRQADAEAGRKTVVKAIADVLPPVVEIVSPTTDSRFSTPRQTVRYRVRTPADAPVTGIKVLVDGRPATQERGVKLKATGDGSQSLEVDLPEHDVTLSLIAESKNGSSVEASVRLAWSGKAQGFVAKPRLYVLAVGVSNYADPTLKLTYPSKDATDFAAAMQAQKALYREVMVKALPDATADQVLDGLEWLRKEVTAKDVGVLFLAGHGVNDADGDYYFLPKDASTERLRRTAIPYFDVKKTLSSLPGKTLAFIDTCHSGNVMGSRRGTADMTQIVNDLAAAENGVVVFTSSTGRQYSLENAEWKNGAFTKAVVEGLKGKADFTGDGAVSINELDTWIADRVKKLTGNQQTPTTSKPATVPDFPIAVVR
jgi:WD40 repeat protein